MKSQGSDKDMEGKIIAFTILVWESLGIRSITPSTCKSAKSHLIVFFFFFSINSYAKAFLAYVCARLPEYKGHWQDPETGNKYSLGYSTRRKVQPKPVKLNC